MKKTPKEICIQYCKESGCPVQNSIDNHRNQGGSENEIKLIKNAYCVRCDVYKMRKWMENKNISLQSQDNGLPIDFL